jgi:hypothetical protein
MATELAIELAEGATDGRSYGRKKLRELETTKTEADGMNETTGLRV